MNPLVDQLAVAAVIVAALAFLIVRSLRKKAAGKNCGGDCGCGAAKTGKPVK
jgi:hypothetical protein